MLYFATVLTILLAAALVYAAIRKLSHQSAVVESYARLGVPETRLNGLAALLLVASAGLLLGVWWNPFGIAALYRIGLMGSRILSGRRCGVNRRRDQAMPRVTDAVRRRVDCAAS